MSRSGTKINYLLRASKNIERKMIRDIVRELSHFGSPTDYRYIGFGAFYFTDFILMHKEFGINKMISIEKDEEFQERYEFNKPYSCIKMCYKDSTEAVNDEITWDGETKDIIWLDYDESLHENMLFSLEKCVQNVVSGSLVIISFNSSIDSDPSKRIFTLTKRCGESRVPQDLSIGDLDTEVAHKIYHRILKDSVEKALNEKNAFSTEALDKYYFKQMFYIKYSDGAPMLTLGFVIVKNCDSSKLDSEKISLLPFSSSDNEPYCICVPNITYKEILEMNKLLPDSEVETIKVKIPFISDVDIEKYKKIYRFYPNFMEINSFN